jgi:hypothetical protein
VVVVAAGLALAGRGIRGLGLFHFGDVLVALLGLGRSAVVGHGLAGQRQDNGGAQGASLYMVKPPAVSMALTVLGDVHLLAIAGLGHGAGQPRAALLDGGVVVVADLLDGGVLPLPFWRIDALLP